MTYAFLSTILGSQLDRQRGQHSRIRTTCEQGLGSLLCSAQSESCIPAFYDFFVTKRKRVLHSRLLTRTGGLIQKRFPAPTLLDLSASASVLPATNSVAADRFVYGRWRGVFGFKKHRISRLHVTHCKLRHWNNSRIAGINGQPLTSSGLCLLKYQPTNRPKCHPTPPPPSSPHSHVRAESTSPAT